MFPSKNPMAPRRRAFNAQDDGDAPLDAPVSRVCAAKGCDLPAALRITSAWCCVYHATANPKDWPKITSTLTDHAHLVREINIGRNLHNHGAYSDVIAGHIRAIERLTGELTEHELAYLIERNDKEYKPFLLSLETLLGGAVSKVVTTPKHRGTASSTPMHSTSTCGDLLRHAYGMPKP